MVQASLLQPAVKAEELTDESFTEHVLALIEDKLGPQLPCYQSGKILKDFLGRFGAEKALLIIDRAFGAHSGMWCSAPVTVLRFQAAHDGFFAIPLLEEATGAR